MSCWSSSEWTSASSRHRARDAGPTCTTRIAQTASGLVAWQPSWVYERRDVVRVSVVVPTWNEAAGIDGALAALASQHPDELLVADGGSTDGTVDIASRRARVVTSARGRARQITAGMAASSGDVVLVLHADCRLPAGALASVRHALSSRAVVGGAFHKRFDSRHPLLAAVRWRTRLWHALGYTFGDQAQFARRAALESIGGLRTDVAAEDMDLAWRLRAAGPVVLLDAEVLVSARRLEQDGVLRTWAAWWRVALRQGAADRMRAWRGMP